MSRTIALLLLLLAGAANAQDEGLGLDLTEDAPREEKKEEGEETPAPPAEGEGEEGGTVATPITDVPALEEAEKKPPTPLVSERDITQDDRVKSVQRKVYLKKHRFEVSLLGGSSVNDPYYSKLTASGSVLFYLADTLGLGVRFPLFYVVPTEDVRLAKNTFNSQIFFSTPSFATMANVEWSPVYGKVAFFNSIFHFDAMLIGGVGAVFSATSLRLQNPLGPHPAADVGAGLRFMARDFFSISLKVINTSFVDVPTGTIRGATQNVFTLLAGVSIYVPFSSTGREAE